MIIIELIIVIIIIIIIITERTANEEFKILWDFKIQRDKHLTYNILDIIMVEKKQVWLIDVAIPGNSKIDQKKVEKITKYKDLKVEVERLGKEGNSCTGGDQSPGSNT